MLRTIHTTNISRLLNDKLKHFSSTFLGVVEKIIDDSKLLVTYFERLNSESKEWLPADEQNITSLNQVLMENIPMLALKE